MKKNILTLCLVMLVIVHLQARRGSGGAAVAGALGGLAIGTMIGSASANDSRRESRAEQEAIRAQDKAERLRIEHEQRRITDLQREIEHRDVDHKISQTQAHSGSMSMFIVLIMFIGLLLIAVTGLSIFVLRK